MLAFSRWLSLLDSLESCYDSRIACHIFTTPHSLSSFRRREEEDEGDHGEGSKEKGRGNPSAEGCDVGNVFWSSGCRILLMVSSISFGRVRPLNSVQNYLVLSAVASNFLSLSFFKIDLQLHDVKSDIFTIIAF